MSVVVAYMPSSQGRAALAAGLREARKLKTNLVVAGHAYVDENGEIATTDVAEVRSQIMALGGDDLLAEADLITSPDDAGEFIVRVAQERAAELIVIGLRRKSKIGKLNLGTAAQRVVVEGPCPVLAVKDDRHI